MGLSAAVTALAVVQLSLAQAPGGGPDAVDPQRIDVPSQETITAPRQLVRTPATLRIGPQRLDLIRYNRVEGPSLGIQGQLRPRTAFGPVSLSATARFGVADRHLNGRLDVEHESVARRIALSGYHELTSLDERARDFGPGNSLSALLLGHDLGDYYRRSGATIELTPPSARPRSYRLRAYAEYHEPVAKETEVQLERLWNDDAVFRPNIVADEGWEVGGSLESALRSSTDPNRFQYGSHMLLQAATGDAEYARLRVGGDLAVPLTRRFRFLLDAAVGGSWGEPSRQRLWYVGGPLTLNGYAPLSLGGSGFVRARVALDRRFAFGRLIVFYASGWAGEQDAFDDLLSSVGGGIAVLDGLIRLDAARQLDGAEKWRFDFYLDQIP